MHWRRVRPSWEGSGIQARSEGKLDPMDVTHDENCSGKERKCGRWSHTGLSLNQVSKSRGPWYLYSSSLSPFSLSHFFHAVTAAALIPTSSFALSLLWKTLSLDLFSSGLLLLLVKLSPCFALFWRDLLQVLTWRRSKKKSVKSKSKKKLIAGSVKIE